MGQSRRGIAAALTSRLATEILKKGIVPFYCCAWSNIGSVRNAVKSGFYPAWVQLDCKDLRRNLGYEYGRIIIIYNEAFEQAEVCL